MSNVSDPNPAKRGDRMVDDHKDLNDPNRSKTKHKFEGWPLLWILLTIFLIGLILWYSGAAPIIYDWLKT
ncbi:hypothetical protein ACJVDH_06585 [Pedobacter sp. AW1-32]|uniref:hypothetical protein n=1 Tax=Pedobacter sp. AW1-32 TaxID=3383026 RepID=UPI003FF0C846